MMAIKPPPAEATTATAITTSPPPPHATTEDHAATEPTTTAATLADDAIVHIFDDLSTDESNRIRSWFDDPHCVEERFIDTIQEAVEAINERLTQDDDHDLTTVISTLDGEVYELKLMAVAVKADSALAREVIEWEMRNTEADLKALRHRLDTLKAQ